MANPDPTHGLAPYVVEGSEDDQPALASRLQRVRRRLGVAFAISLMSSLFVVIVAPRVGATADESNSDSFDLFLAISCLIAMVIGWVAAVAIFVFIVQSVITSRRLRTGS